ncbi:hypothetical protein X975_25308, partial [Stegodyphus mimosarum]
MSKGCHCIVIVLFLAEAVIHASCAGQSNGPWTYYKKDSFFLQPLHNGEYLPPIPIQLSRIISESSNAQGSSSSDSLQDENSADISLRHENPWVPLRNSKGDASVTREIYIHTTSSLPFIRDYTSTAAPRLVTRRTYSKSTFNIPLKKSIRVSHPDNIRPAIKTTGYIRGAIAKRIPSTTRAPMPDWLRESTVHSLLNYNTSESDWKPTSLTTAQPLDSVFPKSQPHQFISNLGSKVDEHLNYTGIMFGSAHFPPSAEFSRMKLLPQKEKNVTNQYLTDLEMDQKAARKSSTYRMHFSPNDVTTNSTNMRTNDMSSPFFIENPNVKYSSEGFPGTNSYFGQTFNKVNGTQYQSNDNQPKLSEKESDFGIPTTENVEKMHKINDPGPKGLSITVAKIPFSVGVKYAEIDLKKLPRQIFSKPEENISGKIMNIDSNTKPREHGLFTPNISQGLEAKEKTNHAGYDIPSHIPVSSNNALENPQLIKERQNSSSALYIQNDPTNNLADNPKLEELKIQTPTKPVNFGDPKPPGYVESDAKKVPSNGGTFTFSIDDKSEKIVKGKILHLEESLRLHPPSKQEMVDTYNSKQKTHPKVSIESKSRDSEKAHHVEIPLPKVPFYGDVKSIKYSDDQSKVKNEDIYFTPTFPELSNHREKLLVPGRKQTEKSQKIQSAEYPSEMITSHKDENTFKNSIESKNDKSAEFSHKNQEKNTNDINSESLGMHHISSKAVTANDFSNLIFRTPTSPPLITVKFDPDLHDSHDVLLDATGSRNRVNRTGNY